MGQPKAPSGEDLGKPSAPEGFIRKNRASFRQYAEALAYCLEIRHVYDNLLHVNMVKHFIKMGGW